MLLMERTPLPPPVLPKNDAPEREAFLQSNRAIWTLCLVLALVFWLITKLSYTYQDVIVVQLEYKIPEDRVLTFQPVNQLEVMVSGTGWELLRLFFSRQDPVLTIPIAANEARIITTSSWVSKVSDVLSQVQTLNIQPETIRLKTEVRAQKTVPIVLDQQVRFAPMHQLTDTFVIEPNTVEITGPASIVRAIKQWKTTVLLPKEPVDDNINVQLGLVNASNDANLTFSIEHVRCKAEVEELTEKSLSIPVEIINAPDSVLLVLLPKTVQVVARVGLSDYDRLSANDFQLVADFANINLYEDRSVRVQLQYLPNYASSIRYTPKQLDYIISNKK